MGGEAGSRACFLIAAAFLASAIQLFIGLGSFPLVDPDEPRYAESTRRMIDSGDWLVPWFNGAPRFEKPALINWIEAPFALVLGDTEAAYRLPSALATLTTAVLLALAARAFGISFEVAWAGAAVFLTAFRPAVFGRLALVDPVLVLLVTATFFFVAAGTSGTLKPRRAFLAACASGGLSFFAKGPIGVLIPAVGILLFACLRRFRVPRGLPIGLGAIIFSALAFPWFLFMMRRFDGAYLEYALLRENVARIAGQADYLTVSRRPAYFYAQILPSEFLPWTVLLGVSLAFFCLRWRRLSNAHQELARLSLCWAGAVLGIVSPSGYKLPHYILPMYPALALLCAVFLDAVWQPGGGEDVRAGGNARFETVARLGTAAVLLAAALGIAALVRVLSPKPGPADFIAAFLLAAGGIALLARRMQPARWVGLSAGILGFAYMALAIVNAPAATTDRHAVPELATLMRQIADADPDGPAGRRDDAAAYRVAAYRIVRPSIVYYAGRRVVFVNTPRDLKLFLAGRPGAFVFLKRKDLSSLPVGLRNRLAVLGERRDTSFRSSRLFRAGADDPEEHLVLARDRAAGSKT